ncbi:exonuclease domain-containing protein [Wenzhouxiangella marina]|uniref:exonuclease domain-containing protein n=1 Tax=Wenzhouxiangella marina TaxID=1579979 RepID=UPI0021A336DE|nr:exonuclease domain-containing protein [Wenzhouxiangella marina]
MSRPSIIVQRFPSFDRKFWEQESRSRVGGESSLFLCSLLLARRLFPDAPNHKLATLVRTLGLPSSGRYHRALADAECTAHLFIRLQEEIGYRFQMEAPDCGLLLKLQKANRRQLERCVERHLGEIGTVQTATGS